MLHSSRQHWLLMAELPVIPPLHAHIAGCSQSDLQDTAILTSPQQQQQPELSAASNVLLSHPELCQQLQPIQQLLAIAGKADCQAMQLCELADCQQAAALCCSWSYQVLLQVLVVP